MLLSDFEDKAVVNVADGSQLGFVDDLKFDPITGRIFAIIVEEDTGIFCFFRKPDSYEIPWNQVIKIGEDVIIVNYPVECQITNNQDL